MKTIDDICLEVLVKGGGDVGQKSEFYRLAYKEFKLSPKKISMIRIKGYADMDKLPALKEFVLSTNKKLEVVPWDAILEYLDSKGKQAFAVELAKSIQNFDVQYEYFSRTHNTPGMAQACARFKKGDMLQDLFSKAKSDAEKQLIKEAVSKA